MITENLSTLKIHKLTQEQYDREFAAGRIDENALYLTPDEDIDLSEYVTINQLNSKADANHNHNDKSYRHNLQKNIRSFEPGPAAKLILQPSDLHCNRDNL